jgi:hypothetical protein
MQLRSPGFGTWSGAFWLSWLVWPLVAADGLWAKAIALILRPVISASVRMDSLDMADYLGCGGVLLAHVAPRVCARQCVTPGHLAGIQLSARKIDVVRQVRLG